jgi:hypothetical protein
MPSVTDQYSVPDTEAGAQLRAITHDVLLPVGIFVMLVWPWVFLSIFRAMGDVQTYSYVAEVVIYYPQCTRALASA